MLCPGSSRHETLRALMPDLPNRPVPRDVFVQHDGQWYRGTLIHQYRDARGEWRAVVRYCTGVMENRAKGCAFTELRPALPD